MIARAADFLWRQTYLRYIGASAAALGVDGAFFLMFLHGGMAAAWASVVGYSAGIVVHWLLSSRAVFSGQLAMTSEGRNRQKLLFIISALTGLAITAAIVGAGAALGIDPRIAKLCAVAVAFQSTYLIRKSVVFG